MRLEAHVIRSKADFWHFSIFIISVISFNVSRINRNAQTGFLDTFNYVHLSKRFPLPWWCRSPTHYWNCVISRARPWHFSVSHSVTKKRTRLRTTSLFYPVQLFAHYHNGLGNDPKTSCCRNVFFNGLLACCA